MSAAPRIGKRGAKSAPALTPWFSADTPPLRPGVYEMCGVLCPFHYWNGTAWMGIAGVHPHHLADQVATAPPMPKDITYHLHASWRGIADPSSAAK